MDSALSLAWDDYTTNFSTGIENCLKHGDFVDCSLFAEGKTIRAHRLVLSICSPYFRELFQQTSTNTDVLVPLNVPYAVLVNLLQFMYCGEVNLNETDLPQFLSSAETLQIKGLSDNGCANEPQSSIDVTSSSQLNVGDEESMDGQETKKHSGPRSNKRAREQSISEPVAPKRSKVCHSMDARSPLQRQTAKATVVNNSFGEQDSLALPNEALSLNEHAVTQENVKVDMYDETGYTCLPDEGAAHSTSDENQQLILGHISNVEMEAMDNWNEEQSETDNDYNEERTFGDNQGSFDLKYLDKCPYCNCSPARKSDLKKHIKEQHTQPNERPFQCAKCSFTAKRRWVLGRHEKTCKN